MECCRLSDLITSAQTGCSSSAIELHQSFQWLIQKYANKLDFEDAGEEMLTAFYEIVSKIKINELRSTCDNVISKYINKSLYHHFIKVSEKQSRYKREIPYDYQDEYVINTIASKIGKEDQYFNHGLDSTLKGILTSQEIAILCKIYMEGKNSAEIARDLGISRQAVSQMKNRAIQRN